MRVIQMKEQRKELKERDTDEGAEERRHMRGIQVMEQRRESTCEDYT